MSIREHQIASYLIGKLTLAGAEDRIDALQAEIRALERGAHLPLPLLDRTASLINRHLSDANARGEALRIACESVGRCLAELTERLSEIGDGQQDFDAVAEAASTSIERDVREMSAICEGSGDAPAIARSLSARLVSLGSALRAASDAQREHAAQLNGRIDDLSERLSKTETVLVNAREAFFATRRIAVTDPLTGVANRRSLIERATKELSRAARDGSVLAALMIDIDHFKTINDRYGHAVGDATLIQITRRLRRAMRDYDFLGRYGGEEFVALLPMTNFESAVGVAQKLRLAVRDTPIGQAGVVTVSIGSTASAPDDSVESLLDRADQAMYQAKNAGRDRTAGLDALSGVAPGANPRAAHRRAAPL